MKLTPRATGCLKHPDLARAETSQKNNYSGPRGIMDRSHQTARKKQSRFQNSNAERGSGGGLGSDPTSTAGSSSTVTTEQTSRADGPDRSAGPGLRARGRALLHVLFWFRCFFSTAAVTGHRAMFRTGCVAGQLMVVCVWFGWLWLMTDADLL